jgi:hypothetical protein
VDIKQIREAVARGWCRPETSDRVMDAELAEAIAREVLVADATPNLGCATTRQLFDELIARADVDGRMEYRTVDSVD